MVFCSPECQKAAESGSSDDPMGLKSHSELDCHELQLFAACKDIIDEEEMEKGEPQWLAYSDLPQSFLESKQPAGWSSYAELRGMPTFSPPFMALVTDALSFPLTLVHALGQCLTPPSAACSPTAILLKEALAGGVLRIHLMGAEWDSEGTGEDKWMEILHLLPDIKALELVLVGPSLPDECHEASSEMCAMLADEKEGRPYTLTFWKGNYEVYMQNPDYTPPHLAVAFHSGLADLREEWRPAITPLINRGIPLLLTHYHKLEADFDYRTLKCHFKAHIVGDNFSLNPYQSLLPIPDVFEGRVYYCNHFTTLAWGSSAGIHEGIIPKKIQENASSKKRKGEHVPRPVGSDAISNDVKPSLSASHKKTKPKPMAQSKKKSKY